MHNKSHSLETLRATAIHFSHLYSQDSEITTSEQNSKTETESENKYSLRKTYFLLNLRAIPQEPIFLYYTEITTGDFNSRCHTEYYFRNYEMLLENLIINIF